MQGPLVVAWGLSWHSIVHRALAFAVGVVHPRAGAVVERGALFALLVEEADAVGEALARLRWGGAEGLADVEVLGLDAARLAVVELLLVESARANAHVVALRHEFSAYFGVVALAPFGVVVYGEGFVLAPELAALADDVVDCA